MSDEIDFEKFRAFSFERSTNNPSEWYEKAVLFKRVAEEIDIFDLIDRLYKKQIRNDKERELLGCAAIYKFLIGISFENLLKAIIIAHGNAAGNRKVLHSTFAQHKISKLIPQIDSSKLRFNEDEIGTLLELEKYVVWAGRYPVPKKYKDYDMSVNNFDNTRQQKEAALWERLYRHLEEYPSIKHTNEVKFPYHKIVKRWFAKPSK
jgi:hypothetical protein